jgi:glycerol kinase
MFPIVKKNLIKSIKNQGILKIILFFHKCKRWTEQDPQEVFEKLLLCIEEASNKVENLNPISIGITNQRVYNYF